MPRRSNNSPDLDPEVRDAIRRVLAMGDGGLSLPDKLGLSRSIHAHSPEAARSLSLAAVEALSRSHETVEQLHSSVEELGSAVEGLRGTPYVTARVIALVSPDSSFGWQDEGELPQEATGIEVAPQVLVRVGGGDRIVDIAPEIPITEVHKGRIALLDADMSVVLRVMKSELCSVGETCVVQHVLDDGRLVVSVREEQVVVERAESLRDVELAPGDRVRWSRDAWMAFEAVEREEGHEYMVEDVDEAPITGIGGLEPQVETLMSELTASFVAPELAAKYGLEDRRSVLLVGPPGNGKTLLARSAAWELHQLTGLRCKLMVVKPGQFESPWVGQTQQNIRDCFTTAAEAAEDAIVLMFFDEIEAIGRVRGGAAYQHSDKFLTALLAELDGFKTRGRIIVVSATNRKDLIDPALLQRLSDVELTVPRPSMSAAEAIFGIHLPVSLPFAGDDGEATRMSAIAAAVSTLYAPNADNKVATVHFRDRKAEDVFARDLMSGRVIRQITTAAQRRAFLRDRRGGAPGIGVADVVSCANEAMDRLASTLTVHNVHSYLDIPADRVAARVDPARRVGRRTARFLAAV